MLQSPVKPARAPEATDQPDNVDASTEETKEETKEDPPEGIVHVESLFGVVVIYTLLM